MQNYQQGIDLIEQKNYQQATEYFLPYAQQGCAEAQYHLATAYYKLTNTDKNKLWFEWFKKSAQQNYLPAVEWLCKTRWFINDPSMVDYANQGIALGSSYCKYLLAHDYVYGKCGLKQDIQKGLELYHQAAEQGEWIAYSNLSEFYAKGEFVAKDDQKALDYMQKSVEAGHNGGALTLARWYFTGTNVKKDKTLAYEWLKKAVELGAFYAQQTLDTWQNWCDGDTWPETPISEIFNHVKIDF